MLCSVRVGWQIVNGLWFFPVEFLGYGCTNDIFVPVIVEYSDFGTVDYDILEWLVVAMECLLVSLLLQF
jgi:hypothetical protein